MILPDTHIWIWWVQDDPRLLMPYRSLLKSHEADGLGISIISCWEVAKLVEKKRMALPLPPLQWIEQALGYPGARLLNLTSEIAVQSTQLMEPFHPDPADRFIVATALIHDIPLVTEDVRIRGYLHVRHAL